MKEIVCDIYGDDRKNHVVNIVTDDVYTEVIAMQSRIKAHKYEKIVTFKAV